MIEFKKFKKLEEIKTDILLVPSAKENWKEKLMNIDPELAKNLGPLAQNDFKGKEGELIYIHFENGSDRIGLLGIGEGTDKNLREAGGKAIKFAEEKEFDRVSFYLNKNEAEEILLGASLATYRYNGLKKEKKERKIPVIEAFSSDDLSNITRKVSVISKWIKFIRDLGNTPANYLTPQRMAEIAKEEAQKLNIEVEILGKGDMEKLGMGGILGVSKGSVEEPKLIILKYNGGGKKVALVGKAVTFDSGGISLKSRSGMEWMKYDMMGGATVMGVIFASAELNLEINLIGAIPATENLPDGSALKPGDVIRHYNGKTSEIISTDAEGRLILADALSYVEEKFKPDHIIDLATLTGAIIIALGHNVAGVMGTDEALIKILYEAGEETGERVWQLPLYKEYEEQLKSEVADINNSGGRAAGAITAATFLKNFVDKTSWAHIDIAGVAWTEKKKLNSYTPKGATGFGIRLLLNALSKL